ncbi:MAG: hypothetical protein U1F33_00335 [Alphaproteobacteria bacterium]
MVTLFDEAGPTDPHRTDGDVDLDRLVWDPEYRAEIQRTLRPCCPGNAANDDAPRPLKTVA